MYEWRSSCVHVAFSTGGAPGDFPVATDTCDTLPHDATLDAAPSSLEMVLTPDHDAKAKRQTYQNQSKKKGRFRKIQARKRQRTQGFQGRKTQK